MANWSTTLLSPRKVLLKTFPAPYDEPSLVLPVTIDPCGLYCGRWLRIVTGGKVGCGETLPGIWKELGEGGRGLLSIRGKWVTCNVICGHPVKRVCLIFGRGHRSYTAQYMLGTAFWKL